MMESLDSPQEFGVWMLRFTSRANRPSALCAPTNKQIHLKYRGWLGGSWGDVVIPSVVVTCRLVGVNYQTSLAKGCLLRKHWAGDCCTTPVGPVGVRHQQPFTRAHGAVSAMVSAFSNVFVPCMPGTWISLVPEGRVTSLFIRFDVWKKSELKLDCCRWIGVVSYFCVWTVAPQGLWHGV